MVRSYFESDEPDESAAPTSTEDDDERRGPRGNTEDRGPHRPGHHKHRHCREDRGAELEKIDRLHCAAAGNKAESDYVTAAEPKMQERDGKLGVLPGQYAVERIAAQKVIDDVADPLHAFRDQVACQLDQAERATFQHAWQRVQARVDRCAGPTKLCPSPQECQFPVAHHEPMKTLTAHQAQYTARVEDAENQFDELAKEPAALKHRAADLTTEVTNLPKLPAATASDHRARYAALLVAEYHATAGHMFAAIPSSNAYEDYLRRNLSCSVEGRRALTEIVGQLKVRECQAEKRRARCTQLQANLAEEILAEVEDLEDEAQDNQHEE